MSDVIDSRDLLDELKTLDEEDSYDKERIEMIDDLKEEVGKDNFEMGVTFIRENYWVQYCEELAYDCGYVDGRDEYNPISNHIDWEGWADAVGMDYSQTDFNNDTYYWRA